MFNKRGRLYCFFVLFFFCRATVKRQKNKKKKDVKVFPSRPKKVPHSKLGRIRKLKKKEFTFPRAESKTFVA